ncbi:hypothetical protein C7405_1221, partial [Paraburkholderia caballeronis]
MVKWKATPGTHLRVGTDFYAVRGLSHNQRAS